MRGKVSIGSVILYAGSALCFLLPFVTVSCGGVSGITLTGQQLATGTTISQPQVFGPPRTQHADGDPFALLAGLSGVAGIVFSCLGRSLAGGAAGCGGAGIICLLVLKGRLDDQIQKQGMGMVQVTYESGYWMTMLLFLAGAAWNLYLAAFEARKAMKEGNLERQPIAEASHAVAPPLLQSRAPAPEEMLEHDRMEIPPRRFCTSCGSQVSPSERFCAHCRALLGSPFPPVPPPEPKPPVEPGFPAAAVSSVADLPSPGMAAVAETPSREAVSSPSSSAPATFATTAVTEKTGISSTLPEPAAIAPAPATLAPLPQAAPPVPTATAEPTPVLPATGPDPRLERRSKSLTVPVVVAALVLVVAAAGATLWLFRQRLSLARLMHPSAAAAATPAASAAPPPAQTSAVNTPASEPNPPASAPESSQTLPPAAAPVSAPLVTPSTPPAITKASTEAVPPPMEPRQPSVSPPQPTPTPVQNPVTAPAVPTPPRSGTLHYSGPPVPHGGVVVFSGLPAGRLRFTFDHQSWQPLISHQPDGTQTLTLRSLRPYEQAQCDVQWEMVP